MNDIYPVTIIRSRYGGVYEGAEWVAFNEYPLDLSGAMGSDAECCAFFSEYKKPIGRGKTPMAAYKSLIRESKKV